MYWTLHMGNWIGLLGKNVTFLGGLIASILPVTGFFIWWNKLKRIKDQEIYSRQNFIKMKN